MSFLSSAWKAIKGVVLPAAGYALGGPVGGAIGGLLGGGGGGAPAVVQASPTTSGQIMRYPASSGGGLVPIGKTPPPGAVAGMIGAGVAAGVAGYGASKAIGTLMSDGTVKKRRRRRRGITATELKNYDRVDNFLNKRFKCSTARRISKR